MADEKSKIVTDATGPDAGPAPVQPEAGGGTPAPQQEQPAPEAVSPDNATAPEQATHAQPEKGADASKEQKAASVSVFNFSEIMAEKKAAEKAAAKQEAKAPDKGTPPTHQGGRAEARYPLQLAAQSGGSAGGKLSLSCDRPNIQGQHSQLSMKGANKTMGEEWSNNACRGYVIKAMENCGFHAKEIQQVLTELYEVFDFCAVEEAADYFENWQS